MTPTEELRQAITDVLMTPNQRWKGMKSVPIELIWGLEALLDRVRVEAQQQWIEQFKREFTGIPSNTVVTLNVNEIIKAAERTLTQEKGQA